MAGPSDIIRTVMRQRSKRHPEQNLTCHVGHCKACGKEVVIVACDWKAWQGWCHHCAIRRPPNKETGLCGIYAIRNNLNGKCYYGSTTDWYRRKYTHRRDLRLGKHHCQHLQRAWNKYGEAVFEFVWLGDVPRELLFDAEEKLMREHPDKYNTGTAAGAAFLGRKHTVESREKMRRASLGQLCLPETREKLRLANLGKKYSMATRQKVGVASRGKGKGYCWDKKRKRWLVQMAFMKVKRYKHCDTENEAIALAAEWRTLARKEVACGGS